MTEFDLFAEHFASNDALLFCFLALCFFLDACNASHHWVPVATDHIPEYGYFTFVAREPNCVLYLHAGIPADGFWIECVYFGFDTRLLCFVFIGRQRLPGHLFIGR